MKNIKAAIKGALMANKLNKQLKEFKNTKDMLIGKVMVDGKAIRVYHNHNMIHQFGLLMGATEFNGIRHLIMVDDYYMQAPADVQRFILQHECGHIYNKDLCTGYLKKVYSQLVSLGSGNELTDTVISDRYDNIQREYNADMYAVHMCGKKTVERGIQYAWSLVPNEELIERNNRIGGLAPLKMKDNLLSNTLSNMLGKAKVININELNEDESEVM